MINNLTVRDEDNIIFKRKNKKMLEIKSSANITSENSEKNIKIIPNVNKSKENNDTGFKPKIENNLTGAFKTNSKI